MFKLHFRMHTGSELLQLESQAGDAVLKQLWHHSDAIMCCSVKMNVSSVYPFYFALLNLVYLPTTAWQFC